MPSTKSIFKDLKSLSYNEIEELFNNISELISFNSMTKSIHSDSREQRYSNGVTPKYLTNYLHWFKWLQTFLDYKKIVKARQLIINSSTKSTDMKIEQYKTREPNYV